MMYSLEDIIKKEKNIFKAIIIIGKEASRLNSLDRTTIKKPLYKAIEHFMEGKIDYEEQKEE